MGEMGRVSPAWVRALAAGLAAGLLGGTALRVLPERAARADEPTCRGVEVLLKPVPRVQMAVWVEDDAGKHIDTLYVTRLTGTLGLANRPGLPTFKSDYRFPYGSREMVM